MHKQQMHLLILRYPCPSLASTHRLHLATIRYILLLCTLGPPVCRVVCLLRIWSVVELLIRRLTTNSGNTANSLVWVCETIAQWHVTTAGLVQEHVLQAAARTVWTGSSTPNLSLSLNELNVTPTYTIASTTEIRA